MSLSHRGEKARTEVTLRSVVIIINRAARHLASEMSPLLAELRQAAKANANAKVIETFSLDALATASSSLSSVADGMETTVVLAGGDGSHMAGVTALTRSAWRDHRLPNIALAPGGTVCTVAQNWGLPSRSRDHIPYVRALLLSSLANTMKTTARPTLRIREPQSGAEYTGFIFGAGLVARFFEEYEAKGASGYGTAARIVARIFAGSFVGSSFAKSVLDPSACEIEVDGQRSPVDRISLLCASVVRDLGLHMRLLYRAGEENDRFHVVATPLGARLLGPQMPLVLAGRPLLRMGSARIDTLASTVTLRFPKGRGAYVLDGDLMRGADEIEVSTGPVLNFVTPS